MAKWFNDPSHLLWFGLIAAILCSSLALVGFLWLHFTSRTISPLGSSGAGPSQISDQTHWRDNARLTLAFDSAIPTAIRQEGVRCYHWHSVPGITVKWSTKNVSFPPGYTLKFLEFTEPTHTDSWRVRVGNEIADNRVDTTSATGAVVRAMGDLRGKTIDIQFSKDRILDP
jgi:hypothetical protein